MHSLQVAAYNSEGKSNPSQVVEFITKPDRPGSPCRLVIRGRVLPTSFKMAWGEPHRLPFSYPNPSIIDVVNSPEKNIFLVFFLFNSEPPKDDGGAEVTKYVVELSEGLSGKLPMFN